MGNGDFKVVTQKIRDEAKIWQQRVDDTTPIVSAVQGAAIEFGQIDSTLRKIADEYDRTESVNELDLDKTYHV